MANFSKQEGVGGPVKVVSMVTMEDLKREATVVDSCWICADIAWLRLDIMLLKGCDENLDICRRSGRFL